MKRIPLAVLVLLISSFNFLQSKEVNLVTEVVYLKSNYKQKQVKDTLQFFQIKGGTQFETNRNATNGKLYLGLFITSLLVGIIIAYLIKKRCDLLKLENKKLLLKNEQIRNTLEKLRLRIDSEEKVKEKHDLLALKILTDDEWGNFRKKFELLYPSYVTLLQDSKFHFTKSEKRFLILKKLGLDSKVIADMIGISNDSVLKTQYRIRKKIATPKGTAVITYLEKLAVS